ncbi:phospho-sugar mutase [Faecousia sp. CLA-AA-H192]|uniref:phosphoglucomutase (alpha-D-glucose-1,6-bisphosphate-dependent) n=1 Tax=Faecousia intestinalis TaxID=3133167 RepID=A0ABV1G605_9FIRM
MTELERYQQWCERAPLNEAGRAALAAMQNDETERKGCFGAELQFGTAGIRGIMGIGTNRLNDFTVRRTAQGLAAWLTSTELPQRCAIGYDSRHNSRRYAELCAVALAERGVHVYVYHELAPTPMLSFAVRQLGCGCGIVVSASHNAGIYNGIKCYGPDGCQMTDEPAARVFAEIEKIPYFLPAEKSFEDFLAEGGVEFIAPELWERYYETVLGERLATVPSDNLNLLYTPLCGTGNKPVRTVLGRIGVNVAVVPAQEKPDGDFKTCEYPNPETDAALNESYKIARETHPDLILGTDPDCDRVAVAVPVEGGFRKLSGNELGCLLLDYILGTMQKAGTLPADPVAVRSIVSTPMADKIAASYGVKMRRVLTGFKYIGGEILALEQKHEENRFVFGFEESCGYLKGTYARDKDAVVASMLTCDLAAALKREGTNLAEHMDALYSRFGWHEARVLSCELQGPDAMEISAGFMAQMRRELPKAVCGIAVTSVTDYQARVTRDLVHGTEEAVTLPKSNVLVLQLGEKGTVILRPSGTEPKVKIYLTAVDTDRAAAMKLLDDMAAEMSGYLPKNA